MIRTSDASACKRFHHVFPLHSEPLREGPVLPALAGWKIQSNIEHYDLRGSVSKEYKLFANMKQMRSLVQRLSIGDFVFSQGEGPRYPSAELERLARFENLGGLSFKGPLPKNIGVLRNLHGVKFEANDKLIDLGVLQACGPALRSIDIVGTRSFHDGHVTIEGLEKLVNVWSFTFESSPASLCEVEVVLKVGTLHNLLPFVVKSKGRLLFKGERKAFEQLCTGLDFVIIRHYESSRR
jgi:hypothetical protein